MDREQNLSAQEDALILVQMERDEQDKTWGEQRHDPAYWLAILGKQVGQLGEAVLDYKWAAPHVKLRGQTRMYHEAKQVAAVAVAIMEAIDENRLSDEVTSSRPDPRRLSRVLHRDDESVHGRGEDDDVVCYCTLPATPHKIADHPERMGIRHPVAPPLEQYRDLGGH